MYGNDFYLTDTQCTQENVDWLWHSLCTIKEEELVLDQTYQDRFCPFVDEIARFISESQWCDQPKAWAWLDSHGCDEYFETYGREASDDEWLTLYRWSVYAAIPTLTKERVGKLTDEELLDLGKTLEWHQASQRKHGYEEIECETPLGFVSAELAVRRKREARAKRLARSG